MEIRNAKITSTMLGREDHGILTFMVFVEFGCSGCGIGGYAIDQYDRTADKRVFSGKGLEAISKILETVGVDKWEDLPNKYIRIKDNGWGSTIDEIGNLMEEKWFNLREFFANNDNNEKEKNTMKVMRKQGVEVQDIQKIQMGDQIVIPLAEFGEFTATAQKITEKGVLFMFDDCVAEQKMNDDWTNKGGYAKSHMKKWIDTVLLSAFPEELQERIQDLALPTYGMMFGHDDWYERAIEPDNDEQLPLMAKRKNRAADFNDDYEWYWLQNETKKDYSAAAFAYVTTHGNPTYDYASHSNGVRPVFWLVK